MFISESEESAVTGAAAEYFESQRRAWGFLPNYVQCFADRPEVADAWTRLNLAVRDGMDRRRFEIATVAAAREFGSTYCTVAHAKFLRDVCHDEATIRAVAADPTGGSLAEPDRSVFRFATLVARAPASIGQADVDALRAVGLSDRDVAGVVYAVAARAFFTTVLDGLGARLDAATAGEFDPELLATMLVGRAPDRSPV